MKKKDVCLFFVLFLGCFFIANCARAISPISRGGVLKPPSLSADLFKKSDFSDKLVSPQPIVQLRLDKMDFFDTGIKKIINRYGHICYEYGGGSLYQVSAIEDGIFVLGTMAEQGMPIMFPWVSWCVIPINKREDVQLASLDVDRLVIDPETLIGSILEALEE